MLRLWFYLPLYVYMNNNHWEKGKRSIFAFREEKRGKTLGRFYSIFGSMFVCVVGGVYIKINGFLGKIWAQV